MVRIVTCVVLISLQIVLFVASIVIVGKQMQTTNTNDSFIYHRLVPMSVVYGSTLLVTVALDSYWTVEVYHYAKEGRDLIRKNYFA